MGNLAKGRLPGEQGIWKNAGEATNGDHTNYSYKTGFAAATLPAFYTLDLGSSMEVSQIRILLFDGLGHREVIDNRKYTFDLNVSVDGKQFHKVFGESPEHQGNGWFIIDLLAKPKIRFVQLHGTGNTENRGIHIVEFAVYDVAPSELPSSFNKKRFSVAQEQMPFLGKSTIFISHSSDNKAYGDALVDLLEDLGVESVDIKFTSNHAYGIGIGMNIFEWLKERIVEKPHVIFLLSPEYYKSVPCLNEMGAAWVVGNDYTMIFTQDFELNGKEFLSGALDPRKMGFHIDNETMLFHFAEQIMSIVNTKRSVAILNQKIKAFLKRIEQVTPNPVLASSESVTQPIAVRYEDEPDEVPGTGIESRLVKNVGTSTAVDKFLAHLCSDKAKACEILLIHYVIDLARVKLRTGWKTDQEVNDIKAWEEANSLNNELSTNYDKVVRMLEMRKVAEVSETTSNGNPREIKLAEELVQVFLDLPKGVEEKIKATVRTNADW